MRTAVELATDGVAMWSRVAAAMKVRPPARAWRLPLAEYTAQPLRASSADSVCTRSEAWSDEYLHSEMPRAINGDAATWAARQWSAQKLAGSGEAARAFFPFADGRPSALAPSSEWEMAVSSTTDHSLSREEL